MVEIQLLRRKRNSWDVLIRYLKIFAFTTILVAAAVLYKVGVIWGANDLVLTAAVLVILNKLDRL